MRWKRFFLPKNFAVLWKLTRSGRGVCDGWRWIDRIRDSFRSNFLDYTRNMNLTKQKQRKQQKWCTNLCRVNLFRKFTIMTSQFGMVSEILLNISLLFGRELFPKIVRLSSESTQNKSLMGGCTYKPPKCLTDSSKTWLHQLPKNTTENRAGSVQKFTS